MSNGSMDITEHLATQPWDDYVPRLVAYALRKARRLRWQGTFFSGVMPGGKEAQDVVQETVFQLISGERKWDPVENPDLFAHLQSIIDSKISHLVESWDNRSLLAESTVARRIDETAKWSLDLLPGKELDPEEGLLAQRQERLAEDFALRALLALEDDKEAQGVLGVILDGDGIPKRQEIAQRLGMNVKAVDAARKRIQRKLRDLRSEGPSRIG